MRDDPGLDNGTIAACLESEYGIQAASITFLPIGYDLNAAVYEVGASDGSSWFVKIRSGPLNGTGLLVPRALLDLGIDTVLAPVPSRRARLWCPLGEDGRYSVVLYPFIRAENAMVAGMSPDQWRAFGATLRAIHDSALGTHVHAQLPSETFSLPSAAAARHLLAQIPELELEGEAAVRLAAFWQINAGRIDSMLNRAAALGRTLQARQFDPVLCHGDIHAANVLVGADGRIWLVDWDGPLIAPRERDLLFVIGSRIARPVEPMEEHYFFAGYGPVAIEPEALVYFRYERILEDLGQIGTSVLLDRSVSEQAKSDGVELAMSFFAPEGDIERAETVHHRHWPDRPT